MLQKTNGIVLKTTDYGDNSVIAKIYTQNYGLQSFLIQSVKQGKKKIKMHMLQPLSLLQLVAYIKPNQNIHRLSDAQYAPPLKSIPYQLAKSAIAIFINEIIYKSLNESDVDEEIFDFLKNAICYLDEIDNSYANFPLMFLLKFSAFLGFGPDMTKPNNAVAFDLVNGVFTAKQCTTDLSIEESYLDILYQLLTLPFQHLHHIRMPKSTRNYLLKKMLLFYNLHVNNFGSIKSFEILKEVFE